MDRRMFVQITPGLEPALLDELAELGLRGRAETGGVELRDDPAALYAIHLLSRVAARVTVRVGRFRATTLDQLGQLARKADWKRWVHPHQTVDVRVTAHNSRLRHRETVANKVQLAIRDALRGPRIAGGRPPREPALVVVRIEGDMVEMSVDASGDLLHRRGWRQATAKAPLRENLAAAVLRLAGWSPGEALVDPMCGSGTFPIEAATIAMGKPPGARRAFAFERWPSHDRKAWAAFQGQRTEPLDRSTPILAADRDPGAIEATRGNAKRAGVEGRITVMARSFWELEPPAASGLVIANPPYGRRVGDAVSGFSELGRVLRERWTGWRVALLMPDPSLMSRVSLPLEEVARFANGGISVRVVVGAVPRG